MRLNKIPKGCQIIAFINNENEGLCLHLNKRIFLYLEANSCMIIDSKSFYVGFPLKEFPEMQLYCKYKIEIKYT